MHRQPEAPRGVPGEVDRVLAKQELLEIPVWGGAATKYGIIPVARADGAKALRDTGVARLLAPRLYRSA